MVNNCKVDFMSKEIRVSKGFYKAAQIVGTKEFDTMITLQEKLPAFRIVYLEHTEPIHKAWYPTYNQMVEFIRASCSDADAMMDELRKTMDLARITGKGYNMVRGWFVEHCYSHLQVCSLQFAERT